MTRPFLTLPGIIQHAVCDVPLERALGWRTDNGWHYLSTPALRDLVRRTALGLREFGIRPGDRVALMGASSPQWLIADLAILAAGAISVPVYQDCCPDTFRHQLADAGIEICYILDDHHLPLLREHYTHLRGIIAADNITFPAGIVAIREHELRSRGADILHHDAMSYARLREHVAEQDVATIIYTSGSTGKPKGVRLTHRNLVSQVLAAQQRFPLNSNQDVALSCLPLAHVFERMVCYFYLASGIPLYFSDKIDSLATRLAEVQPTVMTLVPRLAEKIRQGLRTKAATRSGIGGWLLRRSLSRAERGVGSFLDDFLVHRHIRARFGGRLRMCIVGGAACALENELFFKALGIPLYVGYGCTESAPVIACNYPGSAQLGSVGEPFPGVDVRIDENGEILARGPNIMQGYHNLPTETRQTIDDEGWLHTGDLGYWHNGRLVINGRQKELLKTSGGKYVSPVPIEQRLEQHPAIEMALVVAEGRKHSGALLFYAEGVDCDDLTIHASINQYIHHINASLDHWQHIHCWSWAGKPPTPTDGGLTPTHKLRRSVLRERHADLITDMYTTAETLHATATQEGV